MDTSCEQCGGPVTPREYQGGRPQRFCSTQCKNRWHVAQRQRQRAEDTGPRSCRQCGGPIPATAPARARCCSRACNYDWQNARRAEARLAAWQATGPRCENPKCGKPLPMPAEEGTRRHRMKFCSDECKRRVQSARWRQRAPGYMRQYNYGVTPEQWDAQMAAQDGRCAICRSDGWPAPGRNNNGRPHAEHDPATGEFRGITCGFCNLGMGLFKHDPLRLASAIVYLTRADPDKLALMIGWLKTRLRENAGNLAGAVRR
jgi:Recombination endonuclease VII